MRALIRRSSTRTLSIFKRVSSHAASVPKPMNVAEAVAGAKRTNVHQFHRETHVAIDGARRGLSVALGKSSHDQDQGWVIELEHRLGAGLGHITSREKS